MSSELQRVRAAFDRAITFLRAGDGVMAEQTLPRRARGVPGRAQSAVAARRRAESPGPRAGSRAAAAPRARGRAGLRQGPRGTRPQPPAARPPRRGHREPAARRSRSTRSCSRAQLTLVHALAESGRALEADGADASFPPRRSGARADRESGGAPARGPSRAGRGGSTARSCGAIRGTSRRCGCSR